MSRLYLDTQTRVRREGREGRGVRGKKGTWTHRPGGEGKEEGGVALPEQVSRCCFEGCS